MNSARMCSSGIDFCSSAQGPGLFSWYIHPDRLAAAYIHSKTVLQSQRDGADKIEGSQPCRSEFPLPDSKRHRAQLDQLQIRPLKTNSQQLLHSNRWLRWTIYTQMTLSPGERGITYSNSSVPFLANPALPLPFVFCKLSMDNTFVKTMGKDL